jgi:hypothetical protein
MRSLKHRPIAFIFSCLILLLTNCDDNDKKSDDEVMKKLAKTWTLVSATLDGDESGQILDSFTLKLNEGKTYEVTGTEFPSPWPSSGTFTLETGADDEGTIIRDDNTDIAYSIASNGQLTLSFSFTGEGYAGAKLSTVSGNWVFVLE